MAVARRKIRPQIEPGAKSRLLWEIYLQAVSDLFIRSIGGSMGRRVLPAIQRDAAQYLLNDPIHLELLGVDYKWTLKVFKQAGVDIPARLR